MTAPTWTFRQLVRLPTEEWTQERLGQLPGEELADLCCLAGISYSGTKKEKIECLLVQTKVQRQIRGYGLKLGKQPTVDQIQAFANSHKGWKLKAMCRTVECYADSTKYAMAASLIGWRFGCVRQRQEFYGQANEQAKNSPTQQLVLKLY